MRAVETLAGPTQEASTHTVPHAPVSWGMAFLLLFTMVAIGRVQEVLPALEPLRMGLITGGLAALAWISAPATFQDKVPLGLKQVRYVLAILALAVISIPTSVWPGNSFDFVTQIYWKAVLFFLLVLYWCRSLQDMRRIAWVCSLSIVFLVVNGLVSGEMVNASKDPTMDPTRFHAGSKSYDPNDLALALIMVLPLLLYLISTSGARLKVLLVGMVFVSLYGIVLTKSRGGLLTLMVVGAFVMWRSKLGLASKVLVVMIALLVFGTLASSGYWNRIETMWDPKTEYDQTAGGRTKIWTTALSLMAARPWGVGIAGFETAEGLSHGGAGVWYAAHNSFLQIGVELGVIGLAIFGILLVGTIADLRRTQAAVSVNSAHSEAAALAAALEVSLWGFLVGGFFLSQAYNGLLYIFLGLSVACARLAKTLDASSQDS